MSLDLVEYNPLLDMEERTDRVVLKLVKTISSL